MSTTEGGSDTAAAGPRWSDDVLKAAALAIARVRFTRRGIYGVEPDALDVGLVIIDAKAALDAAAVALVLEVVDLDLTPFIALRDRYQAAAGQAFSISVRAEWERRAGDLTKAIDLCRAAGLLSELNRGEAPT